MTMRRSLTTPGVVLLAGLAVAQPSAQAADLGTGDATAESAIDWTSVHATVFGGFAWADRDVSLNDGFDAEVFSPGSAGIDGDGWIGGIGAGFDLHAGQVVIGLEADAAITGIEGTRLIGTPKYDENDGADGTAWRKHYEVDYLGTVRGRFGILAKPSLLIYGTGGLAWARVSETHSVQDGQNPAHARSEVEVDHLGWTAGGGVEWAFRPGWSLQAEYLYFDFEAADYAHDVGNTGGAPDLTSADLQLHAVKAGLRYRF